jgi:anthranilate synthase/aminodeoxychorismate synthase-like glutamine amidotransferase
MSCRVLIFDNYDSFTYNLYNLIKSTRSEYDYFILRNKDEKIFTTDFDVLVISPGPMRPANTGLLKELFQKIIIPNEIPVFGVCLGMQFIAEYFGENIVDSPNPLHGIRVPVLHHSTDIFHGIKSPLQTARYNSLEVNPNIKSKDLKILAKEDQTESIMALKHINLPFVGVQFHPESFLTINGSQIIDNFFKEYVEV